MAPKKTVVSLNLVNLNKRRKINAGAIKKIAGITLKKLKIRNKAVNIIFVTDKHIKRLNKKFKKKNKATDVLCFPIEEIADIFISSDTAAQNAKRFKMPFQDELCLYVAHGILHLSGYKDNTFSERKKMRKMERKLLEGTL